MKKFISLTLVLAMCLCVFAGCGTQEQAAETTAAAATETTAAAVESNLPAAKEYLYTMYKDALETTPSDYQVVGTIVIGTEAFEIEWTSDSDTISFVRGEDKMVTVDVNEENPKEVKYVLTATMKDEAGNTESVSFQHRVPAALNLAAMSDAEIVAAAYELEEGANLPSGTALKGSVVSIDTPWSDEYHNITVSIAVEGAEEQPVQCFRLSGEGADKLAEGDSVVVAGVIKNYKGTIEFDKGCKLISEDAMEGVKVAMAGYGLEEGMAMKQPSTMTGVIKSIDTPYSDEYKNITVTIVAGGLEDYAVQCFRLSGEGADKLAEGNTITVTGTLKNYKGTVEFDKGCTLDAVQ